LEKLWRERERMHEGERKDRGRERGINEEARGYPPSEKEWMALPARKKSWSSS
jgi:hypothetical protein